MQAKATRGYRRVRRRWTRIAELLRPAFIARPLDATVLEDRTLYSATPLALPDVPLDVHEDAPDTQVHLPDIFSMGNASAVQYQLLDNSAPHLFDSLKINASDDLVLDYAADQHGIAQLLLQATDGSGNAQLLTMNVNVVSVNDAPTMRDLQQFTTTDLVKGETIVDLFAAFDDKEDADDRLTFRVLDNNNASLFESSTIDMDRGLLILKHADGQTGSAQLTISATDRGGLSVGTPPSDIRVFQEIKGEEGVDKPEFASIGIEESILVGHWTLFDYDYDTQTYDFSRLDVENITEFFLNYDRDPSLPIVLDIELAAYNNTAQGRELFAEAFALVKQLRPDLEIGIYRIMPERSWHNPVGWNLAQQHLEWGIETWYTERAELFQTRYEAWHDRNELFRTEPLSDTYGGQVLADMVDFVSPSLYTFFRNESSIPYFREAYFDADTDRITVEGTPFEGADIVRFERATGVTANSDLIEATDFYVVNDDGRSFQISRTPGGAPIDIQTDLTDGIYVGALGPNWDNPWHDPFVQSWRFYAEENIAEARKFNKPVYAWIGPTLSSGDRPHLEPDVFRWHLELLRPMVDGIFLYKFAHDPLEVNLQQGWYTVLKDFMASLDDPAGTLTVTIPSAIPSNNQAPIATADSLSTVLDTGLTFSVTSLLANDRDADGDRLSAEWTDAPAHGTLTDLGNGRWTYTPDSGFTGTDSFQYRAYDGEDYSNAARVQVEVAATNHVPVANDDAFAMSNDETLTIDPTELLANDVDGDGDSLTIQIDQTPAHGTVKVLADGRLEYTPNPGFVGSDQWTYRVSDGSSTSSAAVVTVAVGDSNQPLAAKSDVFALREDQSLVLRPDQMLANDRGVPHDGVQIEVIDEPAHGRLQRSAEGALKYVPDKHYHGIDRFNYRIVDGDQQSNIVSVQLHIQSKNDRPVARPDIFRMTQGEVLRVHDDSILDNDVDHDDDRLRAKLVQKPHHGRVILRRDGTFVYKPERGFAGKDAFEYRLIDEQGASSIARVRVRVGRAPMPLVPATNVLFEAAPHQVGRAAGRPGPSQAPSVRVSWSEESESDASAFFPDSGSRALPLDPSPPADHRVAAR